MVPSVRIVLSSIALTLAIFAMPAHAQDVESGTGATASGATMDTSSGALFGRLDVLLLRLPDLGITSRADLLKADAQERQLATTRARLASRRVLFRLECAKHLRAANRDTLLPTAEQCQRTELTQDLSLLRDERAILAALPSVTEEVRARILRQHDDLAGAIEAMVDGIDAHVFLDIPDLAQSKARLLTQYRFPYAAGLLQLRADRQRAWIRLFLVRLRDIAQQDTQFDEHAPTLLHAIDCLEGRLGNLEGVLSSIDYQEMKIQYSQFQSSRVTCAEFIRTYTALFLPPPTSDPSSPEN